MADRTRKPWILNGVEISRNPSACQIQPQVQEDERWMLNVVRKELAPRRSNDPRVILYRDLQCSWFFARRPLISLLTNLASFHRAGFPLSAYQEDFVRLNATTPNFDEAAVLVPANFPISGTCAAWFVPHRGIDTSDLYLYLNGTLVTSGITWDYAEGKVTFATARPSSDTIQAFYRWKPLVKISSFDSNPIDGRSHDDPRYNPSVTFKQL